MINYLAYGSNLCSQRLIDRIGAVEARGTVRIADYRLDFTKRGADGSGKCTLVAQTGAASWGAVYRIRAEMRSALDRIEGLDVGYGAAWWDLEGYGPCYVYLALEHAIDPTIQPYDWYKALVIAGAREHGFPSACITALDAVPSTPDPDRARASRQLAALA